jgi:hypothetical protein
MNRGELASLLLSLFFILLFLASFIQLIKGVIRIIKYKSWKSLVWGVSLLTLTSVLIFIVILFGQILSIDSGPVELPPLKDAP